MEKQSSPKLTKREQALRAVELEREISVAVVSGKRKEVRALLDQWESTMDDPGVRSAYRTETGGVDPDLAKEDLKHLAA